MCSSPDGWIPENMRGMAPKLPGSLEGSKTVSALDLLHLARTAAERAAGYLRAVERPSDPGAWTQKGSRDFVTEVDRTAERMITDILVAAEPGSRIVGEELSDFAGLYKRAPAAAKYDFASSITMWDRVSSKARRLAG